MYRHAFPACEVVGSYQPVPFSHLGLTSLIPGKCSNCEYLFEGCCTRSIEYLEDYSFLDYGPCPIEGDCTPKPFRTGKEQILFFIPAKCVDCNYLTHGGVCHWQKEIWDDFSRSLDWGSWRPKWRPLGIKQKVFSTDQLLDLIAAGKTGAAVKLLRDMYPSLDLATAIAHVKEFAAKLKKM
jgi:hypothetical protein